MPRPNKIKFRGATYVLDAPHKIKFRGATYVLASPVTRDDALETGKAVMTLLLRAERAAEGKGAKEAALALVDTVQKINKKIGEGDLEGAVADWEDLKKPATDGDKPYITRKSVLIGNDPAFSKAQKQQISKELHQYDGDLWKALESERSMNTAIQTSASVKTIRHKLRIPF